MSRVLAARAFSEDSQSLHFKTCTMDSFLCLLLTTFTAEASFFDIFPVVDPAQHAVYDAESLQIVGTARVDGLQASLSSRRWRPVQLSEDGKEPRALMSVGIGDFRNTSSGPYRELAIAFPACENEDIVLDCGSFMHCQDKLPACAHTFMFRSYASNEAAVLSVRSAGISAQLSTRFDFSLEKGGRGHILAFSVMGSEDDELMLGKDGLSPFSPIKHFDASAPLPEECAMAVHEDTWLCIAGCLAAAELCSTAAGSVLLARSCAASLLERAAATALSTNDAACLRLEEMETSMGEEDLQKALSCLSQAQRAVRDLLVSADATGRLGLGLQRSAAVAGRLEETLAELRALRRREELALQWMSFMEQPPGHGSEGDTTGMADPRRGDQGYRLQLFVAEGNDGRGARHICSFPSGLQAAPARIVGEMNGGDFFRDVGFQPEGAMHLPSLQVVRLPSWGGMTHATSAASAIQSSPPAPRQASASGRTTPLVQAPVESAQPSKAPARGQSDFMDMVREFNEGHAVPKTRPVSEMPDLLQQHLHKEPATDPRSELLAAIAGFPAHIAKPIPAQGKDAGTVSSDSEKIDWKPEELDNVLKFHNQALCREGDQRQLDELLYVKVRDRAIDHVAMKEPPSDPPDWLPELHRQTDRKTFWGLVATKAPVEPAPNPLKLEKIFDEPDASQKEEFAHHVLCMAMVGKNTLRLAAAVAESVRDPSQTRESLNRKVEEYWDRRDPQRMADLLIKTGLIDLGTRKKIGTAGEVCHMFYALMGLQETARDYVAACPRYPGRTPSYIEFGEMDPPTIAFPPQVIRALQNDNLWKCF
ncbi:unnamed protein product [Symbiodinium sp. KB8]|nr:unnamed protein product [Symbiodinium sp. KB8]